MDGQVPSIGPFSISNIQLILIRQMNAKKNRKKRKLVIKKIGSDEVGS